MRVVIITLVVWAIILGFFVSGVRVMATPPTTMHVQSATVESSGNPQQVNPGPSGLSGNEEIRPGGSQGSMVHSLGPN